MHSHEYVDCIQTWIIIGTGMRNHRTALKDTIKRLDQKLMATTNKQVRSHIDGQAVYAHWVHLLMVDMVSDVLVMVTINN